MRSKHSAEFEKFDQVMGGLLAVPYQELQKQLADEKKAKAKSKKKKRPTSIASSSVRASSGSKKRVA